MLPRGGKLHDYGDKVRFLGRSLERNGDKVFISEDKDYYLNLLQEPQMKHCREAPAPAAHSTTSTPQVVEDVVYNERDGLFIREVGKLQWQVCIMPELARSLKGPTEEDFKRHKHLLRCIKGSLHFKMPLRPSTTLPAAFGQGIYLRAYVDAIGAGCPSTRKSTSGALLLLFCLPGPLRLQDLECGRSVSCRE